MTMSISGTAVPQPPTGFSIELYGRVGRQIEGRLASAQRARQRENERKLREARHQAKHDVEMLCIEHARAMAERDLYAAIELERSNPELAAKLRERIQNRGIGKVPNVDEEAVAKRKGGTASDLIDFMRAVTMANNHHAGITHQPGAPVPIERDVTPIEHNVDGEWFEGFARQPDIEGRNDD